MPPLPASTLKPSRLSRSTYQAADLYSRKAGSAKCQITWFQSESERRFSFTQSKATDFTSESLRCCIATPRRFLTRHCVAPGLLADIRGPKKACQAEPSQAYSNKR